MNCSRTTAALETLALAFLVLAGAGCSDSSTKTNGVGSGGATFGGQASSTGAGGLANGGAASTTRSPFGGGGVTLTSGSPSGGVGAGGVGVGGNSATASTLSVDCSNIAATPISVSEVSGARAYHDVVFSKSGNLVGNTDGNLMTHAGSGAAQVFVPGIGTVEGMDILGSGDIVAITAADDSSTKRLVRVTSSGGQSDISTDVGYAYGVLVGPDGMIYVGSDDGLLKFDPTSGQRSVVYETSLDSEWQIHFMDYSPDRSRLYLCTNTWGEKGAIRYFDMDGSFKPTTKEPKLLAEYAGSNGMGGYCDGLAVDSCGNLYVADFNAEALFRITPAGAVSVYKEWSVKNGTYVHGMAWGIAAGSWDPNALYLPQPYNKDTVVKVVVGVPGRAR